MPKKKALPEVNIGLLGHVDHGKSSLVESLAGKWPDTHSEERMRGISIRLGYADATFYKCEKCEEPKCYCTSNKCITCFGDAKPLRAVSFVDAPGHEILMATVLSAASIMDGVVLVIGADEECPQPQTEEHLTALDIIGIKNIVIVQNKIDLVDEEQLKKNYKQIKELVKGTVAEDAPVIPVSATNKINIDALIQALEKHIPTPKRNENADPRFLSARSFDINKPGQKIKNLKGGVLGGSVSQGVLKKGDEIEIKPGIKQNDYQALKTRIAGINKSGRKVEQAGPGGLVAIQTELDPYLTKSDSLAGSTVSLSGKLPPLKRDIRLSVNFLEKVAGVKEKLNDIKTGEILMLTHGTTRTVGTVTSAQKDKNILEIKLKLPVCAKKNDKMTISKRIEDKWRLIGYGFVE